jgi:aryl-alcohol dehydrogenase-like predicted oxidoreductase
MGRTGVAVSKLCLGALRRLGQSRSQESIGTRHQVLQPPGRRPQPPRLVAALDHPEPSRTRYAAFGTDWIDLYQLHRPDTTTDIEETLSALTDLVHQGNVRYIGHWTFRASKIVASSDHRRRCATAPRRASRARSGRPSRQRCVHRTAGLLHPMTCQATAGAFGGSRKPNARRRASTAVSSCAVRPPARGDPCRKRMVKRARLRPATVAL